MIWDTHFRSAYLVGKNGHTVEKGYAGGCVLPMNRMHCIFKQSSLKVYKEYLVPKLIQQVKPFHTPNVLLRTRTMF